MMDASLCLISCVALALPYDTCMALQKKCFRKSGESFNLIKGPCIPTLLKQGPHYHKVTDTTLGLVLIACSLDTSRGLRLPL